MNGDPETRPRILLGVTVAKSLILMRGLPELLLANGWDVHVVSSPGPGLDDLTSRGISVHPLSMAREPSPAQDLRSLLAWRAVVRDIQPDVVFSGTPKAGLLGMLAGRLARVPVRIYHLRGLRLETATGWRRHLYGVVERIAIGASTSTLSVSKSLSDRVVALGLGASDRITVLGSGSSNGVDLAQFSPGGPDPELQRHLGIDPSIPVIGFVGRLAADKGARELIEASKTIARRGLHHQLLVVGEVEDQGVLDQFLDLKSAGVPVVLAGHVVDSAPYYRLMTLFCLPTYREGFPNVVLEATASGVCVVTTDATGARDSVVDGESGVIVPVRDAPSLALAFIEILMHREKREDLARAGRERTAAEFGRHRVQESTIEFLARATRATQACQRGVTPSGESAPRERRN